VEATLLSLEASDPREEEGRKSLSHATRRGYRERQSVREEGPLDQLEGDRV